MRGIRSIMKAKRSKSGERRRATQPRQDRELAAEQSTASVPAQHGAMADAAGRAAASQQAWTLVFAAWLVSTMATLGALFFGEVMRLPTCALCWYQRIFMFPLAVILPFALFPFDAKAIRYALALAVPGALLALFHQLLVMGVIPESVQPCQQGIPCSQTVI